jgi:nicotinate-nucleotide pyrophosphorylase (carboxylating)
MNSQGFLHPAPHGWQLLAERALQEDVGHGDITSTIFNPTDRSLFYVEAQEEGVLCGIGIAAFLLPDQPHLLATDGQRVHAGEKLLEGEVSTAELLARERTALNFLMHLSGIATLTARFVEAVQGTHAQIVDTRKTVPGLRDLQKYAVRCGGGRNHRLGLDTGAMIKDNHILAAGSISQAVTRLRSIAPLLTSIEIECGTLEEVAEAVDAGADLVMLDNMSSEEMAEAVRRFGSQVSLEASGGVNLDTVREIAETGVHFISVGALTHSAPALHLHLEVMPK